MNQTEQLNMPGTESGENSFLAPTSVDEVGECTWKGVAFSGTENHLVTIPGPSDCV